VSAAVDVAAINQALRGKTELLAFELVRLGDRYGLKLTLGRSTEPELFLLCEDVQNLELNPAGNGFAQVTDMREDGLDRIRFRVEEMEREALFLHCAHVSLAQGPHS
jgi:hypothetical protein